MERRSKSVIRRNYFVSVALGENLQSLVSDWLVDRLSVELMVSKKAFVNSIGVSQSSFFD
jgi:hypothetical protein